MYFTSYVYFLLCFINSLQFEVDLDFLKILLLHNIFLKLIVNNLLVFCEQFLLSILHELNPSL